MLDESCDYRLLFASSLDWESGRHDKTWLSHCPIDLEAWADFKTLLPECEKVVADVGPASTSGNLVELRPRWSGPHRRLGGAHSAHHAQIPEKFSTNLRVAFTMATSNTSGSGQVTVDLSLLWLLQLNVQLNELYQQWGKAHSQVTTNLNWRYHKYKVKEPCETFTTLHNISFLSSLGGTTRNNITWFAHHYSLIVPLSQVQVQISTARSLTDPLNKVGHCTWRTLVTRQNGITL